MFDFSVISEITSETIVSAFSANIDNDGAFANLKNERSGYGLNGWD